MVTHVPSNFSENQLVCEIYDFVVKHFPSFNLNSCLINYYPDKNCFIPDHSDNEHYIAEKSCIVTISLGASRRIFFKDIKSGHCMCSIILIDGSVLIFSKESQLHFTHGIPSTVTYDTDDYSPRISATFRNLVRF